MRLCHWATRTQLAPWGLGLHPKEVLGNRILAACLSIIAVCDELGIPWTLEQPQGSLMWAIPELHSSIYSRACYEAVFDWCQWGHPWRKRIMVRGRPPWLPSLSRKCQGGHSHLTLEGKVHVPGRGQRNLTEIAAEYSTEWCQAYAQLAHRSNLI